MHRATVVVMFWKNTAPNKLGQRCRDDSPKERREKSCWQIIHHLNHTAVDHGDVLKEASKKEIVKDEAQKNTTFRQSNKIFIRKYKSPDRKWKRPMQQDICRSKCHYPLPHKFCLVRCRSFAWLSFRLVFLSTNLICRLNNFSWQ